MAQVLRNLLYPKCLKFSSVISPNLFVSLPARSIHTSVITLSADNDEDSPDGAESESKLSLVPENTVFGSSKISKIIIPDYFPDLTILPLARRPLFPGFYKTLSITNAVVASHLMGSFKKGNSLIGLFLSKNESQLHSQPSKETVGSLSSVYSLGTVAQIINILPVKPDGATAIILPKKRILITSLQETTPVSKASAEVVSDQPYSTSSAVLKAISHEIFTVLTDIAKLNSFFRDHITHHNVPAAVFEDYARLADFVAILSSGEAFELQEVLSALNIEDRLRKALVLAKKELMSAELQNSISKDVEASLNKKQREYFLREQLKSIKKELGIVHDEKTKIIDNIQAKIEGKVLPEQARKVFDDELDKLSTLDPAMSEFNVTRNYAELIASLPWNVATDSFLDMEKVKATLNEDHYGMDKVKDIILEYLAVGKLRGSIYGKILCFVGPPGVGKTSIGKSIAAAMNRKFYRFSVGGLSDVAEIKGHRRTYIGAMPGKIVQALKRTGVSNPLVMIDEIDKIGRGHMGDPSAALLEMLDPEQNSTFEDHYLDIPYDLSQVLFVCTANQLDTIPHPLLDRMEVIELSGYVLPEKLEIARKYLAPRSIDESGLKTDQVEYSPDILSYIIRKYSRESGVRGLRKLLDKLNRKIALKFVSTGAEKTVITEELVQKYLGPECVTAERLFAQNPFGVATGLAWTSQGGCLVYVETVAVPSDTPVMERTGKLGKVMEESSSIAFSFVKKFLGQKGLAPDFFMHHSIHLHVPEGATPKDGPSAGCTMATALISLALGEPVKTDLAMTGELTLSGRVLKIGGVKEKTIAAQRSGLHHIIFPKDNYGDWTELPDFVTKDMKPYFVTDYEEIFKLCFDRK